MCHCSNRGVEQTPNKSQHAKLTLEKKILLQLLLGFELTTFRSRVPRSNQQAIPVYRIAYIFVCVYVYRGLCISQLIIVGLLTVHVSSLHFLLYAVPNIGNVWCIAVVIRTLVREQHFLGPFLWASWFLASWFCYFKAWLDHTCYCTGKKEWC